MADKKLYPFQILRILEEKSDIDHVLTSSEILSQLKNRYDVDMERRTLYANIESLKQMDYDVCDFTDNGKGYFLGERLLSKEEVLLLCNAVYASHFINNTQSTRIIEKLLSMLSTYDRTDFTSAVYKPNPKKTEAETLLKNLGILNEAIRDRKQISFIYLHYNKKKKLQPSREKRYTAEPRFIVYDDSRPYLCVTSPGHTNYWHCRIDRMSDVHIIEENASPLPKGKQTEAYKYASSKLFMFAGENINATLKCKNSILDAMIDEFGQDLRIMDGEDGYFLIRIGASEQGILYLAQQYLDAMEILEPIDLRQKLKDTLKDALKQYEK